MATAPIARLQRVELRDGWAHEAQDFTPWLADAENIQILGDAIGMSLEVEAQEKSVGPFSADILCRDTVTGSWVLIENQLERTDHTHLGQLITYAAGLEAVTIVWVAARFTDEHRAAIDWLNRITTDGFNFFALEIELWRIGDSPVAPKFNVVCQPNDWRKTVAASASVISQEGLGPTQRLQLEFWTAFQDFLLDQKSTPIKPKKPRPQQWMDIALGRTGFTLCAVASTWDNEANAYGGELRAELYINHPDGKRFFHILKADEATLAEEMGEPLTWYSKEGVKSCRVYVRTTADLQDRALWPGHIDWLQARLERLHTIFAQRVQALR